MTGKNKGKRTGKGKKGAEEEMMAETADEIDGLSRAVASEDASHESSEENDKPARKKLKKASTVASTQQTSSAARQIKQYSKHAANLHS